MSSRPVVCSTVHTMLKSVLTWEVLEVPPETSVVSWSLVSGVLHQLLNQHGTDVQKASGLGNGPAGHGLKPYRITNGYH